MTKLHDLIYVPNWQMINSFKRSIMIMIILIIGVYPARDEGSLLRHIPVDLIIFVELKIFTGHLKVMLNIPA